jgi:hypothetical protein
MGGGVFPSVTKTPPWALQTLVVVGLSGAALNASRSGRVQKYKAPGPSKGVKVPPFTFSQMAWAPFSGPPYALASGAAISPRAAAPAIASLSRLLHRSSVSRRSVSRQADRPTPLPRVGLPHSAGGEVIRVSEKRMRVPHVARSVPPWPSRRPPSTEGRPSWAKVGQGAPLALAHRTRTIRRASARRPSSGASRALRT